MPYWYDVTVAFRVVRFDVEKTERVYIKSDCVWSAEKMPPALEELAKAPRRNPDQARDGLRIASFTALDEQPEKRELNSVEVVDLDAELGI